MAATTGVIVGGGRFLAEWLSCPADNYPTHPTLERFTSFQVSGLSICLGSTRGNALMDHLLHHCAYASCYTTNPSAGSWQGAPVQRTAVTSPPNLFSSSSSLRLHIFSHSRWHIAAKTRYITVVCLRRNARASIKFRARNSGSSSRFTLEDIQIHHHFCHHPHSGRAIRSSALKPQSATIILLWLWGNFMPDCWSSSVSNHQPLATRRQDKSENNFNLTLKKDKGPLNLNYMQVMGKN